MEKEENGEVGFCSIHWLLSSGFGESNEERDWGVEGIFAISIIVMVSELFFTIISFLDFSIYFFYLKKKIVVRCAGACIII
jgi:hypothetical protein